MVFSKERLDKVLHGQVTYVIEIDGSSVFRSVDLMAALQQFDYLRKTHRKSDVNFKIEE